MTNKELIEFADSFLPTEEKEKQRPDKNKKTRFYGRRFHLTIHGQRQTDFEALTEWFNACDVHRAKHKVKNPNPEMITNKHGALVPKQSSVWRTEYVAPAEHAIELAVIAKEFGKHKIHPHWQVYFELQERNSMKWVMEQVLGHSDFHLELAKSTTAASIAYIYAVGKQHEAGFVVYNLHAPVPARYDPAVPNFWLNFKPRPFQQTLLNLVLKPTDRRKIYYISEPHGNVGKTLFIEYLHIFYGAIVTGGKSADMKHAITRWSQIVGAYPLIIAVDVPRAGVMNKSAYIALEAIKNGLFFTGKYESSMTHAFDKPHVLIFSNRPPKREYFSDDRWVVATIDENFNLLDENGNIFQEE